MNSADLRLPKLGVVRERAEDARHLVTALTELGVTPLLEGSGAELSADAVQAEGIEVLVVGLDAGVDPAVLGALDRVRVVFDDLETSAALTGWDRARWLRHLRAKLLDVVEDGPPRPAGAEWIPARSPAPISAGEEGAARSVDSGDASSAAAIEVAAPSRRISEEPVAMAAPWTTGDDWVSGPDAGTVLPAGGENAREPEPMTGLETDDRVADAVDDPGLEAGARGALEIVELPEDSIAASAVGEEFADIGSSDAELASWTRFGDTDAGSPATGQPVVGLDELLDALRRDDPDRGPSAGVVAADTPPAAVDVEPRPEAPVRAFDLSSLSLEPLEDERPLTGRAQFLVDEAPRAPIRAPEKPAAPLQGVARSVGAASAAWLFAAGDADPARVTLFAESLPTGLDALFLLIRPTSAPWLGATLAVEGADSLPLVLADEVMEATAGRIVVLSPGERAGFNRAGLLTVQPGDHSLPEALGDWMTMRALAARFGRDAGVIVFGRLRDEVLEGAIELARAGGQVWFEASVLEEPNPVVDAARAAGIAMRTGSAAELAQALVARLRA